MDLRDIVESAPKFSIRQYALRPTLEKHVSHRLANGVALRLFASATEAVQRQLEVADRQKVQLYRYIVAQAKSQIQTQIREGSADCATAKPHLYTGPASLPISASFRRQIR